MPVSATEQFFSELESQLDQSDYSTRLLEELHDHVADTVYELAFEGVQTDISNTQAIQSLGKAKLISTHYHYTMRNKNPFIKYSYIGGVMATTWILLSNIDLFANRLYSTAHPEIFNVFDERRGIIIQFLLRIPISCIVFSLIYYFLLPKIYYYFKQLKLRYTIGIIFSLPLFFVSGSILRSISLIPSGFSAWQNDWDPETFRYIVASTIFSPILTLGIALGCFWLIWKQLQKQEKTLLTKNTLHLKKNNLLYIILASVIEFYIATSFIVQQLFGYHVWYVLPRGTIETQIFTWLYQASTLFNTTKPFPRFMPSVNIAYAEIVLPMIMFVIALSMIVYYFAQRLQKKSPSPPWLALFVATYLGGIQFFTPTPQEPSIQWHVPAKLISTDIGYTQFGPWNNYVYYINAVRDTVFHYAITPELNQFDIQQNTGAHFVITNIQSAQRYVVQPTASNSVPMQQSSSAENWTNPAGKIYCHVNQTIFPMSTICTTLQWKKQTVYDINVSIPNDVSTRIYLMNAATTLNEQWLLVEVQNWGDVAHYSWFYLVDLRGEQ